MLRSKLKKLVSFKKWKRQDTTAEMGNCAGSSTKDGRGGGEASRESTAAAEGSKYAHGELVLK